MGDAAERHGGSRVICSMLRCLALCVLAFAVPAVAQQTAAPAAASVNPAAAREIFERDWVLMNWALKFYDADRDILLSPGEAHVAAAAFRSIADANRDGRVTTEEYRAARQFILARY